MLFNSYIFIFLFLPLVLLGYYGLNYLKQYKLAIAYLIGMSFWFYGYGNIKYLYLLIISILFNYLLVECMSRQKSHVLRKTMLYVGLLYNLGNLFYFKYYDFFISNINVALNKDLPFLRIALPLGISFFTFQQLSYVVDYYKEDCEKYSLLEYASYVSFFPQLIAGPIVYHTELIPQFRDMDKKKINYTNLSKGIYAFACGLAKKVLVADIFSRIVVIGFDKIYCLNMPSAILVIICGATQVYFDFSGYSDMAYGIGYMFNIELPINFNSPYKAANIGDFWNRWHITLNRFFIKYVYIPLGGSRSGVVRTYINSLIVFLISGLWHGASWTYVSWGGVNGVAVAVNRACGKWVKKLPKTVNRIIALLLFWFTFVLFKAQSVLDAFVMYGRVLHGGVGRIYEPLCTVFNEMIEVKALYRIGFGPIINEFPALFLLTYTGIILFGSFVLKNTQEKVAQMKYSVREAIVIVLMMIWSIMSLSEVSEFLYYNF